jgi:hypothetical protein
MPIVFASSRCVSLMLMAGLKKPAFSGDKYGFFDVCHRLNKEIKVTSRCK